MSPENRRRLRQRVVDAAEAVLARQDYVSAIGVLTDIRWLDPATLQRWQRGELPYLEAGIQTNPARVAEAMLVFHAWATQKRLDPSETAYVAKIASPELVVIQPLDAGWRCHRCAGTGDLLIMEQQGPSCLACAGLGSLVFLPAGDAALSRRAKAKSKTQGLLVQPVALREAEKER